MYLINVIHVNHISISIIRFMSLDYKLTSLSGDHFWLDIEKNGNNIVHSTFVIRERIGEIMVLKVNQDERRKGYGTKIISLIEDNMKQEGCIVSLILASPLEKNTSQIDLYSFYQKSGYRHFNIFYRLWHGISYSYMYKYL